MFIDTAQKGQQRQLPLQFTITTLIADRLAGVSQFFHCSSLFIGGGEAAPGSSGPRVPLHGVDHEPAKIRRLGGLLLSCYVRATRLRYYALHSYSILYLGS